MSNQTTSTLKQYMSASDRNKLGDLPTTHRNCLELCGVARPGKTARDRAKSEK
jgi:hypothetical protein